MMRRTRPTGPYITGVAAHYPKSMNFQLVARLLWAVVLQSELHRAIPKVVSEHSRQPAPEPSRVPVDHSGRPIVQRTMHLRGHAPEEPERHYVWSLRDVRKSVLSVPGHNTMGPAVRAIIDKYLDDHQIVQKKCIAALGDSTVDAASVVPESDLQSL